MLLPAISGGTISVTAGGSVSFYDNLTFNGGTIDFNNSGTAKLNLRSGAGITYSGTTAASITKSGGAGTAEVSLNTSGTTVFNIADSGEAVEMTIVPPLVGTSGLDKQGAGVLLLSGAGTYNGNTTITAGTLLVGNAATIPSGAGSGNVSVAGTLDLGGFSQTINGLSGAGTVDNSSGTGPFTLTVGDNDQTSSFSGVIQNTTGTVALTKTGAGTLTLSNVNTYTGNTTVSSGTLLVNGSGSLAAGSAVTVSGGTLGGNGTVNGTVSVNSGGTLAAGASVGMLTTGTLTLNGGATNVWEINSVSGTAGTDWDLVDAAAVTVAATSGSKFEFQLVSESLNNFDPDQNYSWPAIAGTVAGYDVAAFEIIDTGFTNDLKGGTFRIDDVGSLKVAFSNNHPPTASITNISYLKGAAIVDLVIAKADLLAGASDPDADTVVFVSGTSTNSATVTTNATDITINNSSGNLDADEYIAYVVSDTGSRTYRGGDTVRTGTNYIVIVRTNAANTVYGQVEFDSFAGSSRMVRFIASQVDGGTTNYLQTNDVTLSFSGGTADYSLEVPPLTTHLSAKTAWSLRKRLAVTWNDPADGMGTNNFTVATGNQLKLGDLVTVLDSTDINDTDNGVTSSDYLVLLGYYLQTVGGDPNIGHADVDGDGAITSADYLILLGNYLTSGDPE
jgi:autotransporter-associated beta strand protein